ncbi:iron complex transport system ATP-binding protein [Melghirimyces thermohalophilus]|uniref:Iron complex transport system ATP-binding protein n=1 Tax=Melghirimyces thermohalophilus TaxID=1236220 RepID=A0A1G6JJ51_9BACL|nr:iron complex transport system ATP-binding protein [Melghirimyces thermohalophilus]
MPVIQLQHINWSRPEKEILKGIDWRVRKGEHWVVLGPNGAGKSALLNIICGHQWPTSGTVEVLGHTYGNVDLRQLRRSIGYISASLLEKFARFHQQEQALDVVLSGFHSSIGLYDRVGKEERERAIHLLEQFGCRSLVDRPFMQLSQGEKQRVFLARAWMAQPQLLILDEPCSGLDLPARESFLRSLEQLAQSETAPTLLYTTHHVEEIIPAVTHVALFRDGQMTHQGTKQQALTDETLRDLFDIDLRLAWEGDRPWIVPGALV